ncbi:hypothetical protein BJ742DRAFT_327316 [Cladochytrium replicatum]|nr:hypothetical protein BJ742DRAFT_327316 [Cladochytrium replicatum]
MISTSVHLQQILHTILLLLSAPSHQCFRQKENSNARGTRSDNIPILYQPKLMIAAGSSLIADWSHNYTERGIVSSVLDAPSRRNICLNESKNSNVETKCRK